MGPFDDPWGGPFDLNHDGVTDGGEWMIGLQMTAGSRQESIDLTGDDTFYPGPDGREEEEELMDDLDADEFGDDCGGDD